MTEREIDSRFGNFLNQVRTALNMGPYKASKHTGIDYGRLIRLERGRPLKSVTTFECRALANAYGIDEQEMRRIYSGEQV